MVDYAKSNGVYSPVKDIQVKHVGTWQKAPVIHQKVNGVWTQIHPTRDALMESSAWTFSHAGNAYPNLGQPNDKHIAATDNMLVVANNGTVSVAAYNLAGDPSQLVSINVPSNASGFRVLAVDQAAHAVLLAYIEGVHHRLMTVKWSSSVAITRTYQALVGDLDTYGVTSATTLSGLNTWLIANREYSAMTDLVHNASVSGSPLHKDVSIPWELDHIEFVGDYLASSGLRHAVIANGFGVRSIVVWFPDNNASTKLYDWSDNLSTNLGYQGVGYAGKDLVSLVVAGVVNGEVQYSLLTLSSGHTSTTPIIHPLPYNHLPHNLQVVGSTVYITSAQGLHSTVNHGLTWKTWYDGDKIGTSTDLQPVGIAVNSTKVFMSTKGGTTYEHTI